MCTLAALDTPTTDVDHGRTSTSSSISSCRSEIVGAGRGSSTSKCSVDLEAGGGVVECSNVHVAKYEWDCRICHMSMDAGNQDSGLPIELGCSCKEDLAAAHTHCAEAWFKIKGNNTCEICGSTARNIAYANESESSEQGNEPIEAVTATSAAPLQSSETRSNFWKGHRFLNFLLACMVFAFVISWLFHFNIPS